MRKIKVVELKDYYFSAGLIKAFSKLKEGEKQASWIKRVMKRLRVYRRKQGK